jgi:hypothetical protein
LYSIKIREPADLLAHQLVECGQESYTTKAASVPVTHHDDLQNFSVEHQAVTSYRPLLLEAIDAIRTRTGLTGLLLSFEVTPPCKDNSILDRTE